ncbi:FKBP12 [Symbiodinium natans]|uniref:peptidylprolyl isomerase n=1 Tax=Symbiodinium natans TaxID=878477 RepID=A0A812MKX4_9DINO|nr:FKBP12 [Symbiodinium natans]
MRQRRSAAVLQLAAFAGLGLPFLLPAPVRSTAARLPAAAAALAPAAALAQDEGGDPVGTLLTVLGFGVVLLGFGFVFWVFSLSPATDSSGKVKASSLQGMANIEDTLEKLESMTPEEADEYQMSRGGLKKEQPKEEEAAEFVYQPVQGADTIYTVLKDGSGYGYVEPGDEVTVHATGLVRDTKTKFWSTKDPGQEPFTYTAGGGVIKGWDYGARGMRKGEVRGLRIPASEGYGPRGFPSWGIPPDADLLFEIEVLDIKRNGQPK